LYRHKYNAKLIVDLFKCDNFPGGPSAIHYVFNNMTSPDYHRIALDPHLTAEQKRMLVPTKVWVCIGHGLHQLSLNLSKCEFPAIRFIFYEAYATFGLIEFTELWSIFHFITHNESIDSLVSMCFLCVVFVCLCLLANPSGCAFGFDRFVATF